MKIKFQNAIDIYSKEELEKYYIEELHSFRECMSHFNMNQAHLKKLFDYFSIKKTSTQITKTNQRNKKILSNIADLESLKKDYLSGNFRQQELADKYSITKNQLRKFIYNNNLNDIKRDSYYSRYTLNEIIDMIENSEDKEKILNNLKIKNKETYARELNVSYKTLKNLLKHYNITNISKKLGYQDAVQTKKRNKDTVFLKAAFPE